MVLQRRSNSVTRTAFAQCVQCNGIGKNDGTAHLYAMQAADQAQREHDAQLKGSHGVACGVLAIVSAYRIFVFGVGTVTHSR